MQALLAGRIRGGAEAGGALVAEKREGTWTDERYVASHAGVLTSLNPDSDVRA